MHSRRLPLQLREGARVCTAHPPQTQQPSHKEIRKSKAQANTKEGRLTVDALELRVLMEPSNAQLAPEAAAAETAARNAATRTRTRSDPCATQGMTIKSGIGSVALQPK